MTTTSGRLSAKTLRSRREPRDRPRPAKPDRPKIVDRRTRSRPDRPIAGRGSTARTPAPYPGPGAATGPSSSKTSRSRRTDSRSRGVALSIRPFSTRGFGHCAGEESGFGAGLDDTAAVDTDYRSIDRPHGTLHTGSQERRDGVELTGRVADRLGPAWADRADRPPP